MLKNDKFTKSTIVSKDNKYQNNKYNVKAFIK